MSKTSCISALVLAAVAAQGAGDPPKIPSEAKLVPYDSKAFRPDPVYGDKPYDAAAQINIYGGKYPVPTTRPLLELGRELYREGPFTQAPTALGKKNLIFGGLLVSGDWRTGVAYNDNGAVEQALVATRLNLDVDLRFTSTERIHAFFRPLEKNGNFNNFTFGGNGPRKMNWHGDGNLDALFFEGDLGRIASGLSAKDASWDLPFAFGLMPLLFQNGVWVEDAFTGVAFTIPARNSKLLDISNADITFFAGFDKVTSAAFRDFGGLQEHAARIYGFNAFIEANRGYWEVGYGYVDTSDSARGLGYHNVTAAFTRRYFDRVSNSLRVIGNFGQNPPLGQPKTADGVIFLIENSLITSKPLTLVPYANFFVGLRRPQSLARDAGAGGILKNTGLIFETDGLTGFPTLDATGNETYGGALGLEYLFNLNQQLVLEAATVRVIGDKNKVGRSARGDEYGLAARYQIPLSKSWILRADAMMGWRDRDENLMGMRMELRYKF
jgi:hypothetical protein